MTKSLVKQCIENIKASKKTFTKDVESDYAFLQKLMAVYICNNKNKLPVTLKDYQEICGVYNFIKDKGYLIDKENCIDFNKLRYGFIKRVSHVVPNFLKKTILLWTYSVVYYIYKYVEEARTIKRSSFERRY